METTFGKTVPKARLPVDNVQAFVASFAQRQAMLQLLRAIAIGVIAVICGACTIVLFDYLFPIDEALRWALTCSLYLIAVVVAWRLGLGQFLFRRAANKVAWDIEQLHPPLREGLIACVELRGPDRKIRSGSPIFLESIERNISRELSRVDITSLLPWKPVYQSFCMVVMLLWGILILCWLPKTDFASRFAKAIVPFATFDSSAMVAANKEVPESPKVILFYREVLPPSYTLLPKETASSTRGDFAVLKGTHVKLELDVNQPIDSAIMAMEYADSGRKDTIELHPIRDQSVNAMSPGAIQKFTAEFHVEEDLTYEVRLISELKLNGKRLENNYSPRYRIDALDDQSPSLVWLANSKTHWQNPPTSNQTFFVGNDAILNLAIAASDNLPLDTIVQQVSINRGEWQTLQTGLQVEAWSPLDSQLASPSPTSYEGRSDWKWNLKELGLRSGDTIATRVMAIDRKGSSAYSPAVQFSLAAVGFDAKRHKNLIDKSKLVPMLESLLGSLTQDRESLRPKMAKLKDATLPVADRDRTIGEIRSMVFSSTKASQALRVVANSLIEEMGRCIDQQEIELLYRLIARVEKEWLTEMLDCAKALEATAGDNEEIPFLKSIQQDPNTKVDRLLQSYDLACENAKWGTNAFRQFIGLGLQTALTRDLTELQDLQKLELERSPNGEHSELSRACEVKLQYLVAIEKLATQVGASAPAEFRNRLSELYKWIDQTRVETSELAKQSESEQSTKELRLRIERTVDELKRVRWVFHLQSNLWWDAKNSRKELLIRAGSLSSWFAKLAQRQAILQSNRKDRSLATDQLATRTQVILDGVNGPLLTALSQIVDRRDSHQRRTNVDTQFASDMGLAFRALTNLLDRVAKDPNGANKHTADTLAIAKAYRVLEASHETVEARLVVQSLLPVEQYDWKSLDAQLWTPAQWESVPLHLEVAHLWLKEAGFPVAIAERYNAIRWSDDSNQLTQKNNARRDANNSKQLSVADDLRALLVEWASVDLAAKPILDEARATLAEFSPKISELAKQAAESAVRMQRDAEQIKQNQENSTTQSSSRLPLSRQESQKQIGQLKDALIEMAAKQNLLNKTELEMARDSDRSLKLIDSVLPTMNEALDNLTEEIDQQRPPSEAFLNDAIKSTSKTVDALEKVSSHFSKLDQVADGADRTEELTRSSDELLASSQAEAANMQENTETSALQIENSDYQRAEELSEIANTALDTLMRKLESELKRNPLMQTELADISKSNLQSLSTELQLAAETEVAIASGLENADAGFLGDKKIRLDRLQAAAEQTDRLAARTLDQAQQSGQRAGFKDPSLNLGKMSAELRRLSQQARALAENTPRAEMESIAKQLSGQVESAVTQSSALKESLASTIGDKSYKDENARRNGKTAAQTIQNQNRNELLHHAKEMVAHSQRQSDSNSKRLQKSQQDLERAKKERRAAQESLRKEPSNEYFLTHLQQVTSQVEQALVKRDRDELLRMQSEAVVKSMREQLSALEKKERANLDLPNPNAALAVEQLESAIEQLAKIQEEIGSAAESIQQLGSPQTPSSVLKKETVQQQQIQQSVLEISRQISRSVRHEARLGNAIGAAGMNSIARNVDNIANGSIEVAKKEILDNFQRSDQAEKRQADEKKFEEIATPLDRSDSLTAQKSLLTASKEMSAESTKMLDQINQQHPSPTTTAENASPKSSGEEGRDAKRLEARDMARMLDVLDRQLHADSASNDQPQPNTQNPNAEKPSGKESAIGNTPKSNSQSQAKSKESASSSSRAGQSQEDRNGARSAFSDAMKAASDKIAGQLGKERRAQRSAAESNKKPRNESSGMASKAGPFERDPFGLDSGDVLLPGMTQIQNRDWGKLREQQTRDAVEGRRDQYDPEFEEAIQAYYRALGNR